MKKFFKRFGKRITSIFLTVIIIVISCVYPFFSVSAIATEVTLFALGSLIWSVAGGILTGGAFTSAESVTNALTDIYNDGLTAGNSSCAAFQENASDALNGFMHFALPSLAGLPSSIADSASIDRIISDNRDGRIVVSHSDLRSLRAEVISSVNDGKDVLITDDGYSICNSGTSILNYGGNLYSATHYTLGTPYLLDDILPYFMDGNVSANFAKTLVAYTDDEIYFLRGFRIYESNSYEKAYVEPLDSRYALGRNARYDTSCTDFQIVVDGSLNATVSWVLSHNGYKSSSLNISSSFFNPYTKESVTISDCAKYSYVIVDDLFYNTVYAGTETDISISDVQGGVISTVKFDGIDKIVSNGQSVGVVDNEPTITFVPVTAADGTTTVDTLIDDVPVAEVEKEIADVQATADDIDGISGAISGAFPDIALDIPFETATITDTSTLVENLKESVLDKFPIIDQCTTLLNNLFNTDYNCDPPNFRFYWDSNGDGEKETYNALDLSFFEIKLTNENLEDKSRFSTPITVRKLVQGFIILIFYSWFCIKVIKLVPTVFGGVGEGISDFTKIGGSK